VARPRCWAWCQTHCYCFSLELGQPDYIRANAPCTATAEMITTRAALGCLMFQRLVLWERGQILWDSMSWLFITTLPVENRRKLKMETRWLNNSIDKGIYITCDWVFSICADEKRMGTLNTLIKWWIYTWQKSLTADQSFSQLWLSSNFAYWWQKRRKLVYITNRLWKAHFSICWWQAIWREV
jgi:hypothetical protein